MTVQEILYAIGAVLIGEKSKNKKNLAYLFDELKKHLPASVSLWFGPPLNRRKLSSAVLADFTSMLDEHLISYEIERHNDRILLKKG